MYTASGCGALGAFNCWILRRTFSNEHGTTGQLSIKKRSCSCDCVNGPCLPRCTRPWSTTGCPEELVKLENKHDREEGLFHIGNCPKDSQGCIMTRQRDGAASFGS